MVRWQWERLSFSLNLINDFWQNYLFLLKSEDLLKKELSEKRKGYEKKYYLENKEARKISFLKSKLKKKIKENIGHKLLNKWKEKLRGIKPKNKILYLFFL